MQTYPQALQCKHFLKHHNANPFTQASQSKLISPSTTMQIQFPKHHKANPFPQALLCKPISPSKRTVFFNLTYRKYKLRTTQFNNQTNTNYKLNKTRSYQSCKVLPVPRLFTFMGCMVGASVLAELNCWHSLQVSIWKLEKYLTRITSTKGGEMNKYWEFNETVSSVN